MKKMIDNLKKIEEYFLITCFAIMGLVLTAQIFFRYAFGIPLGWAEELARYLQIWITFIGIGFGIRNGSHISLSLLKDKMPRIAQYIVSMIYLVFSIGVCICVIFNSPQFLAQQDKLASTMKISLQAVYIAVPLGFGLAALYLIAEVVKETKALIQDRRNA